MKKIALLTFAVLFIGFSFAHQPRLVFKQPAGEITYIQNPEVSQAFYGILSGQKDIYQIVSDTGFLLYANLVVPDMSWSRTDFTVDIIQGNDAVYTRLDGKVWQRSKFFEKFAGDEYLQWPKREKQVPAGKYTIIVSNSDNYGKYSLAIGKIESFPLNETFKTFKAMPALKMQFFQKPRYTIFPNYVGWALVCMILIVLLAVWAIYIMITKLWHIYKKKLISKSK